MVIKVTAGVMSGRGDGENRLGSKQELGGLEMFLCGSGWWYPGVNVCKENFIYFNVCMLYRN